MDDFKINVSSAANSLMSMSSLFNCTLKEAWNKYMHPLITEQISFDEVYVYIQKKS